MMSFSNSTWRRHALPTRSSPMMIFSASSALREAICSEKPACAVRFVAESDKIKNPQLRWKEMDPQSQLMMLQQGSRQVSSARHLSPLQDFAMSSHSEQSSKKMMMMMMRMAEQKKVEVELWTRPKMMHSNGRMMMDLDSKVRRGPSLIRNDSDRGAKNSISAPIWKFNSMNKEENKFFLEQKQDVHCLSQRCYTNAARVPSMSFTTSAGPSSFVFTNTKPQALPPIPPSSTFPSPSESTSSTAAAPATDNTASASASVTSATVVMPDASTSTSAASAINMTSSTAAAEAASAATFVNEAMSFQQPTSIHAESKDVVLNFNDAALAFSSKSTFELFRAIIIFRLCSWQWLVVHSEKLIALSKKIFGKALTMGVIRYTFFAHFCAGENGKDIEPTIQKLKKAGIGSILDYAAENDVDESAPGTEVRNQERDGVISARTYDYAGERECDRNMATMLQCIDTAAREQDGVMAIKLTALGKPSLLQHLSTILLAIRDMWHKEFSKSTSGTISFVDFQQGLKKMGVNLSDAELEKLFSRFDADGNKEIDYLEWTSALRLEDLATRKFFERSGYNLSALTRMGRLPLLDEEETELLDAMRRRMHTIAAHASEKRVRLLVDAEQSYLQPAIDHFALQAQREFNREFPVVYNTYQCYLTRARSNLLNDLERARREGYYFGGKLVRGAYMILERRRAQEKGYPDPILPTIEDTHANYNYCVEQVIRNIDKANLMVASHNQYSVEHTIRLMKLYGIKAEDPSVMFGQLLGMADHLSFTLGVSGYRALKYVPYGPIHEVIPYLVRRAQENSGLISNATHEVEMMKEEVKRRLKTSLGISS